MLGAWTLRGVTKPSWRPTAALAARAKHLLAVPQAQLGSLGQALLNAIEGTTCNLIRFHVSSILLLVFKHMIYSWPMLLIETSTQGCCFCAAKGVEPPEMAAEKGTS